MFVCLPRWCLCNPPSLFPTTTKSLSKVVSGAWCCKHKISFSFVMLALPWCLVTSSAIRAAYCFFAIDDGRPPHWTSTVIVNISIKTCFSSWSWENQSKNRPFSSNFGQVPGKIGNSSKREGGGWNVTTFWCWPDLKKPFGWWRGGLNHQTTYDLDP